MQQAINGLLEKIALLGNKASISAIEKDLLLQYTRALYEQILHLEIVPAAATEPEMPTIPEADATVAAVEEAPIENLVLMLTEEEDEDEEEEMEMENDEESPATDEEPEYNEEPDFREGEESMETEDDDTPESDEYDTDFDEDRAGTGNPEEQEEEDAGDVIILTVSEQPFQEPEDFELEPELRHEKVSGRESLMDFRLWSRDVRSYIGINDKYNFISELFAGNAEAYEEILNEINRMESAEEALFFLEQSGVTTLYKWKADGFSEQIFYNVLSQFFAAR